MFNSDRPIMRPSDIDELFKRFQACRDSRTALYNIAIGNDTDSDVQQAIKAYESAKDFLMMCLMRYDVEVLDLLERGRSDNSIRQYEKVDNRTVPYEPKES